MCRAKRKEKRALEYVKKQGDRLKACQKRAAVSRNDYLLALVTTNTHLRLHAEEYLPSVMKVGVVWGERVWSGVKGVVWDTMRLLYGNGMIGVWEWNDRCLEWEYMCMCFEH